MTVVPPQAAAHDVSGAGRAPKDELAKVTGCDRASLQTARQAQLSLS
jgi:hypothetical protein